MYAVGYHLILLTLRQYESKSYRRFTSFLEECFGICEYFGLSKIPHYTTLQKASARLDVGILQKILESFVMNMKIKSMFAGIFRYDVRESKVSSSNPIPTSSPKIILTQSPMIKEKTTWNQKF